MEREKSPPPAARPGDNDLAVCPGSVTCLRENWQKWSEEHREYQKHNPFSHEAGPVTTPAGPQRGRWDGYGRPPEGSRTERRGLDAHRHVGREVEELCKVIKGIGRQEGVANGDIGAKVFTVEFGQLFKHYVNISNKVVGVLLRARKQGLVHFEGEMLWQGRDDHIVITLLR